MQLHLLAGLLQKAGLEPCSFTDVETALTEMDPSCPPRLIVTDLYMPGIDGWRFCRLLRSPEFASFNSVPIVIVSATFSGAEPERIAADLGAEAFVPSPIDGHSFIEKIHAVLAGDMVRPMPLVLLIEDDLAELAAVTAAFEASGWEVQTAGSIEEANCAIARSAFAAAVIGCRLPEDKGDALLQGLQQGQPDCACLMATSDSDPKLALHWMKRGAAAYVRRPFEPDYLVELCEHARRERALLRTEQLLEVRTQELRDSKANLRETQEIASLSRWELNLTTGELAWSDGIFLLFEVDPASFEASYESFLGFVHPDDRTLVDNAYRNSLATKALYDIEHRLLMPDGRVKWVREICHTEYDEAHQPIRSVGVVQDVTQRRQAELALADHERFLQTVVETTQDGFYVVDTELRLLEVNDAYCRMSGYSRDELVQMRIEDLEANESPVEASIHAQKIIATGSDTFATCHRRKDGRILGVEMTVTYHNANGGRFVCFCRDMTKWRIEQRIVQFANQTNGVRGFVRDITEELQRWLQVEAVGIRIEQGNDYPYYETLGFSQEFVCAESALCERSPQGDLVLDGHGDPALECMCGNVIRGRFDPALPFFTKYGSFWTNSTSELLAQTSEEDRQTRTRNRCNGEGYESVALIPLRFGETCLGLVQLNDHRKDRFTKATITLLERLAGNIAITLAQRQTAEELFLKSLAFDQISDYVTITDLDGVIRYVNEAEAKMMGTAKEDLIGATTEVYENDPKHWPSQREILDETLERGKWRGEVVNIDRSGERHIMHCRTHIVHDQNGSPIALCGISTDITDRKAYEEHRQRQLVFSEAMNQISACIVKNDRPEVILETANKVIGKALQADRSMIYQVFIREDRIAALFEWLRSENSLIPPIRTQYTSLDTFRNAVTTMWETQQPIESHIDAPNEHLLKDGASSLLHEQLHVKSLLWWPFAFDGDSFYVFTINQILNARAWQQDELAFLKTAANQVGLALMKIALMEDLRRSKEALSHSRELLRYIIEHNRSAVAVHDKELRYIYVSQRYLDDYGIQQNDIIGKHHYEVFPDLPQKWRDVHQRALQGIVSSAEEDPFEHPDGSVDWTRWECRPWHEADGSIGGIIVYTEVINERKRAEDALRLFKTIFDCASFGTVVSDLQGVLTYANESFASMHGCSPEDLTEKAVSALHTPEQMKQVERLFSEIKSAGFFPPTEVGHCRRDGSTFTTLMTGMLVRDNIGNPQCLAATAIDLTEFKELQMQLLQAQKMESVGRLAGGVAHDFNNMLGVIIGNVELAMAQLEPEMPIYGDLQEILNAAERSADLTRQLLAFARKQPISPRPIDMNRIVESTLKMLQRMIGEDIDLVWRPGTDLWTISMDPTQVNQILANLCVNARNAIEGVGSVVIETENVVVDAALAHGLQDATPGSYVCLHVSDSGCGIDTSVMHKLFDPFFTTEQPGQGTGLGLATVHGIVKQNEGFISVSSKPGQGAVFYIYLPRHVSDGNLCDSTPEDEVEQGGNETILLVEDESAILNMVKRILEQLGYDVLTANSPQDALRIAEAHAGTIHILITDVIMPQMSGRALADKITSLYPGIACVYMSGYTADIISSHGVLAEGAYFIEKPFSPKQLALRVRAALDDRVKA